MNAEHPGTVPSDDIAVFTLTFSGGLADRNRLPFDQVIRTLQEFQEMVREVGKRIQREAGLEDASGDFGLEIVAGRSGSAFQKGSVVATAVATKDVANAARTFQVILRRAQQYARNLSPMIPKTASSQDECSRWQSCKRPQKIWSPLLYAPELQRRKRQA